MSDYNCKRCGKRLTSDEVMVKQELCDYCRGRRNAIKQIIKEWFNTIGTAENIVKSFEDYLNELKKEVVE